MKQKLLYPLAAMLGVWTSSPTFAQGQAPTPNQQLADQVARRLEFHGLGKAADVQISCDNGTVTLTGVARDEASKQRLLTETRFTPGVTLVRDGVTVDPKGVVTAQAALPTAPVGPTPVGEGNPLVEPAPLGPPGMQTPDMQAPPLPPYAWPTYAPYNNVSRVGYPQAYPYNAFPFIGPFYPFPKVPLGWRKVVLEWEDGHWYMGRASAPHDYWRVKFW